MQKWWETVQRALADIEVRAAGGEEADARGEAGFKGWGATNLFARTFSKAHEWV